MDFNEFRKFSHYFCSRSCSDIRKSVFQNQKKHEKIEKNFFATLRALALLMGVQIDTKIKRPSELKWAYRHWSPEVFQRCLLEVGDQEESFLRLWTNMEASK